MIRLLATQIPKYWDVIKETALRANNIPENQAKDYLLKLLHDLMSDKAQCFVETEGNKIAYVFITRILIDKVTGDRYLYIEDFLMFRSLKNSDDFNGLGEFARNTNCKFIRFQSPHPLIWRLAERLGCKEENRTFGKMI